MDRVTGNLLLDALDVPSREGLVAGSRTREIAAGVPSFEPGDPLPAAMFPTSGTLSLITTTDGDRVESATVGREGLVGVLLPLGVRDLGQALIGQVPGSYLEVDPQIVEDQWKERGRLFDLMSGYLAFLLSQTALAAACNAVHVTTSRTARWLLMTHDRVDTDEFELKQEFLAAMIGVQRPTVSISAGALQEAGFISYRRGRITIVDREGLESATCACYEEIRSEYSRLVPLA